MSKKTDFAYAGNLPSGKTLEVLEAKGRHHQETTRIMGNDESKFLAAFMSVLCRIDGEQLVMEDYLDMGMRDYAAILKVFGELGFLAV